MLQSDWSIKDDMNHTWHIWHPHPPPPPLPHPLVVPCLPLLRPDRPAIEHPVKVLNTGEMLPVRLGKCQHHAYMWKMPGPLPYSCSMLHKPWKAGRGLGTKLKWKSMFSGYVRLNFVVIKYLQFLFITNHSNWDILWAVGKVRGERERW